MVLSESPLLSSPWGILQAKVFEKENVTIFLGQVLGKENRKGLIIS